MPSAISPADQVKEVWTSADGTMAKQTASTRWPGIVQDMIHDVGQTAAQMPDGPPKSEGYAIQMALKRIKDEIQQNKPLQALRHDGSTDIDAYNEQLSLLGECSWLASPWLWSECYLYRRVQSLLTTSRHWQGYDVFKRQKDSTFAKSRVAVEELANRFIQVVRDSDLPQNAPAESRSLLFTEMTEIALWGNATDLSLLSNLSLEEIRGLQGRDSIAKSQRNIVDNDIEQVWIYLNRPSRHNRRVDIVLDNSGFEFFTDVLYAAYLLESGLASSIKYHVKDFPWFVSDVTPHDVESLFAHLESASVFPTREDLDPLVGMIRKQFDSGAVSVGQNPFWTTASSFYSMPTEAPKLFEDLKASDLVIFKGDLNYRKLVKDGLWPHTTPFKDALGPIGANSGLKVLALRTNKSDSCVGVDSESKVKALNDEAPNGAWVRNGKYAVISFSDGR